MNPQLARPAVLSILVLGAVRGLCLSEGETFDQVIAEKGQPASQMAVGTRRVLNYPDAVVKLDGDVVVSYRAIDRPTPTPAPGFARPIHRPFTGAQPPDAGPMPTSVSEARRKLETALASAREIINQPVQGTPVTPQMLKQSAEQHLAGWDYLPAQTPNFIDAHIEDTQWLDTLGADWVTCNLTPGLAFRAKDLETNVQTRFFYTDLTLPKKRLSAEEMAQLDVIYHQIGMYAAYLQRAGHPWTPSPGQP
jgi:hypothetical protein